MADKTGFEVLEILKSDLAAAAIPAVMFAGVDEDAAKLRAAEEHSESCGTKTADSSHLIATIRAVLSRRPKGQNRVRAPIGRRRSGSGAA